MSPSRAHRLEDLDIGVLCGLWALLASRDIRRPTAPTESMAVSVMDQLQTLGVIAVPWPAPRWELPPRGFVTPIEQLAWDYAWPEVEVEGLEAHIEDLLRSYARERSLLEERVGFWRVLIQSECTEYLQFQLTKHGLDPAWASDLQWLPPHYLDTLSLARWKYLIWSGVRQGAMECLRSRFDPKQTRDAIAATLASPSRLSYAHQGSFDGFLPRTDTPHSLIAEVFATHAARLGRRYWTEAPAEGPMIPSASPRTISAP